LEKNHCNDYREKTKYSFWNLIPYRGVYRYKPENHTSVDEISVDEVFELAKSREPVDRSQLGITTPKTTNGLQTYQYGFFKG
jgi:hypothetical protein